MLERDHLLNTFGWSEFETLAFDIIKFLDSDLSLSFDREQVTDNETLFTQFAASGWISVNWYKIRPAKIEKDVPAGFSRGRSFTVSEQFINRLKEKNIKMEVLV